MRACAADTPAAAKHTKLETGRHVPPGLRGYYCGVIFTSVLRNSFV